MDWDRAIERNCEALLRIVGALFALLSGARIGAGPGLMLPRRVWLALLQGLRPAEACLRRLVLIAARNLVPGLAPASRRNAPFPAIAASAVSREPAFRLIEPLKRFSQDGFSDDDDAFVAQALAMETVGTVDGARLHARLRALRLALSDIGRQARRLSRWQARRDALLARPFVRPFRLSPMRPGLPPGWRDRGRDEIDTVLRECHGLALDYANSS